MQTRYKKLTTGLAAIVLAAGPAFAGDIIPPKVLVTTPYGINLADGALQYSDYFSNGVNGADTVTYTILDSHGATAMGTLTINISGNRHYDGG